MGSPICLIKGREGPLPASLERLFDFVYAVCPQCFGHEICEEYSAGH